MRSREYSSSLRGSSRRGEKRWARLKDEPLGVVGADLVEVIEVADREKDEAMVVSGARRFLTAVACHKGTIER
jgi:hypothetical protein